MTDAHQLWLPFDFLKEEQIDWSKLPHYETPTNDNESLLELQYQYRNNGKKEALSEIYSLSAKICGKLISKETKRNKHIKRLSIEERQEKASDAATYIISQLLKNPKWHIDHSFTAYLYLRVKHELYYKRKVDEIVDFMDLSLLYKEGEEDKEETERND